MRIGVVIEETWSFFREIYAEFQKNHQVSDFKRRQVKYPLFEARIKDFYLKKDMTEFLKFNQVVFFEWASELLAYASQLPKTCSIVTRLHRYEMYNWLDKIHWDNVDRIIVVSQAKKKEFLKHYPDQASKLIVIPEAVSLVRFKPVEREFNGNIGILCHLTPRKRVYELILAYYELDRQHPGFSLHIGGDRHERFGDYYEALHQLVCDLGIQDKVMFYGNVTEPEKWYPNIDIFISNSYSEGLQVSPMEAIAAGCYCLSHKWDGASELLPAENLYFTNNELNNKILSYAALTQVEKAQKKGELQRRIRDQFDIQKIKVQIREVVEDAATEYPQLMGTGK